MPKREWDKSVTGVHPKLRNLKPTEEELKQALASAGASMMSPDDKMLAHAAASVETYTANLNFYLNEYDGEDKQEKVTYYRHALAGSLGDMGRFDEALRVLTGRTGHAYSGCAKAVAHVKGIAEAVNRDDREHCNCERPKDEIEVGTPRAPKTAAIVMNRRHSIGKVYSQKHKKTVDIWRCQVCGLTNAHDHIPERQIQIEELRADQDAVLRGMLQSGVPLEKITARSWAKNSELSDHALLADTPE